MSGTNRRFFITIGAGLFCLTCCTASALANVAAVDADLLDGNADTSFDGATLRVLQTSFPSSDPLTLWGPGPRDDFTNIAVELVIDYNGVGTFSDGSQFGIFGNGHIAITFEDQQGSYELSGLVELLKLELPQVQTGDNTFTFFNGGGGLFNPTTAIMPVDFDWVVPDFPGGPFSVLDRVDVLIPGVVLNDYDWSDPAPWEQGESSISLFPASIPEPAMIGPLVLTSLFVTRRRPKTHFIE